MAEIRKWGPFISSFELPRLLGTENESGWGVKQRKGKLAGPALSAAASPDAFRCGKEGKGEMSLGDVSHYLDALGLAVRVRGEGALVGHQSLGLRSTRRSSYAGCGSVCWSPKHTC